MDIQYLSENQKDLPDILAVAVPSPPFEDAMAKALNTALGGIPQKSAIDRDFVGRRGQAMLIDSQGKFAKKYILFLGAGQSKTQTASQLRDLAARAVKRSRRIHAQTVTLVLPAQTAKSMAWAVQLAAYGATLGTYEFVRYKTGFKPRHLKSLNISVERDLSGKKKAGNAAQSKALKAAVLRGIAVANAACRTRDWVNEPAGVMTPAHLSELAKDLGKQSGVAVKVLGRKECEKLGMGMFLAVGRGSIQEPKLIHMTYLPKRKSSKRIVLVGKGITFDSGGYSLKPSANMEDMKTDMAGAAAVISAMGALADLGCKYEVHGIAPCAENLVSGDAYKLGDVLHAMDGTTVEINNTDAEGRLALGDAIAYARKVVEPDELLDFATLTGACMIALGPYTAGVFSDAPALADGYMSAGRRAGEHHWRLPLTRKLRESLKSSIADMRNSGDRLGGASSAALFLRHFAKNTPWVHVDIAGPSSASRNQSAAIPRGGTGFAVASILEYLTSE